MLKRGIIFFILFVGYGPISLAEELPPILKKLALTKGNVIVYSNYKKSIVELSDLPGNFSNDGFSFVKDNTGLYLFPQGTGRVYRLDTGFSKYRWKRIDSTFFTGYNFNSIVFGVDSAFYSFGGHGFWTVNGVLRNYNVYSRQWNAVGLSDDIPWKKNEDGFFFHDTSNNTLTIREISATSNESLKTPHVKKSTIGLFCLDIKNGNWSRIGNMGDSSFIALATLPWGLLVNPFTVLDLRRNRYMKFSEKAQSKILAMVSSLKYVEVPVASFAIDSVLFYGSRHESYDSIVFSRTDLIDTGIPIYTPVQSQHSTGIPELKSMLIVGLGFVASFLGLLLYKTKKEQPIPVLTPPSSSLDIPLAVAEPVTEKHPTTFRSTRILELLEEREKSLLEFLFHHSVDERFTAIQEINKVIGVQNRSVEIQKRMRSDLIGSINQKLAIITRDKKPVINKQRSEFDKRSFEYFITPVHMELVEKILGKK